MRLMFPARLGKILVAVAFDERLNCMLKAAEATARRTGASLRLVHVCDPWTKSYLAAAVEAGPQDLVQALKDETERVANQRLEAVRRSLPSDLTIETAVLSGEIVPSLIADTADNDVGLVIVGANRGGVGGTSIGFSTAVNLITEGTTPVMVMNEASILAPSTSAWTIVVADDFTDVSQAALELGFSMAEALPATSLIHLHVESFGELQQRGFRPKVKGLESEFTRERLTRTLQDAETKMLERAGQRPNGLELRGGSYRMETVFGGVPEEIERTACAANADLVIFGQHRLFHKQTKHAGQVPFKAMFMQARPVIVVPQQLET